jgi:hypothetical protein
MRLATMIILGAALPGVAAAQELTPPAELAALKPFARNWSCDETVRDDAGKDVKVKSEWKVKPAARGFWYAFDYNQKNSKDFPGFQALGYFGFDGTDKKLTMHGFDDGGGRWSYAAAPPAGGGAIAWTGEAHLGGGTVPARFTWTTTAEKPPAATFVLELQVNNEWVKFADGTCKGK